MLDPLRLKQLLDMDEYILRNDRHGPLGTRDRGLFRGGAFEGDWVMVVFYLSVINLVMSL